jgi:hypothetical protein
VPEMEVDVDVNTDGDGAGWSPQTRPLVVAGL